MVCFACLSQDDVVFLFQEEMAEDRICGKFTILIFIMSLAGIYYQIFITVEIIYKPMFVCNPSAARFTMF